MRHAPSCDSLYRREVSHQQFIPNRGVSPDHERSNLSNWDRGTYVSIVTALFGTVLIRFTLNPLYNPDQPSLITIFFAV